MYNKIILIGRLTITPELNQAENGNHYTRFSIAVNRRFKDQKGDRGVDFINVIAWGKLAENLTMYSKKGSLLTLDGELRSRYYEDKTGKRQYVTEVRCQQFQLLESKIQQAIRENNGKVSSKEMKEFEDDLPF